VTRDENPDVRGTRGTTLIASQPVTLTILDRDGSTVWCRSPRSALVTPLIGPPLPGLVRLAPVLPAAPGWWPHHRCAVHHSV